MRLLLTLLALIAGFATPGMTLASARAQVAGAEQIEAAGPVAPAVATVASASIRQRVVSVTVRDEAAPIVECQALAGCSIALSDRPLE